ncbi:hypothetical protein V4886_25110, partial [Ralstonia solanacearum species complex bacterium RW470]
MQLPPYSQLGMSIGAQAMPKSSAPSCLYGRLLFGKMSMSCRTSKKAAVLYPAYTGRIPLAPMESADSR